MPQREDDRWKCFSRYHHMWPKKQSVYISGVCETGQKDVLYIVFQERATPAYMQATSSVKCKKKKHRQIDDLILSYLQISPRKTKFSTITHFRKSVALCCKRVSLAFSSPNHCGRNSAIGPSTSVYVSPIVTIVRPCHLDEVDSLSS